MEPIGFYATAANDKRASSSPFDYGRITGLNRFAIKVHIGRMTERVPFTVEILGLDRDRPVVIDRVICGSVSFEEAKRIGQHLFSIADVGTHLLGYRVLRNNRKLVFNLAPR
jgi:hypothetical protein